MVRVEKEICGTIPRMITRIEFTCDECGTRCDQNAHDPKEWLFQTPRGQLCWDCMTEFMEIEKVNE